MSMQPTRRFEQAGQWMNMVEGMLRQAGRPPGSARDDQGWVSIEGGPLPVRLGALDGALVLAGGEPAAGPMDLTSVALPDGIPTSFAAQLDLGTMMDMIMPFIEMEEPQLADMIAEVASATGLNDFSMTMACGSNAQKSHMVTRFPGWGASMRAKGALPVEGLTVEDLALLPADSTMASLQSVDMHALFDMVLGIAEPYLAEEGFDRPLERIEEMVGIHLERDLLDHMGTHLGTYMSDTTGGGGFLSMVFFMEVKDPAKMEAGLMRISELLNGALAGETRGYVQMRTIDRGGMACHTLTFPGLPIPFEPTLVMGQNNLFMGFTPQAALAGIKQESGDQPSLMTNEEFLASFDGNFSNLYALSYFGGDAFLRDGYGLTSLMCSALSNGVRSPIDPTRDAGLVMPTFHELTQNVLPTVSTTRLEENGDMVTRMESDPSILVGMTRMVGYMTSNPGLWIGAVSGFMGASSSRMVYEIEEAVSTQPSEW